MQFYFLKRIQPITCSFVVDIFYALLSIVFNFDFVTELMKTCCVYFDEYLNNQTWTTNVIASDYTLVLYLDVKTHSSLS